MRLLLFALSLSALGVGSYVGLTMGRADVAPDDPSVTVEVATEPVMVGAASSPGKPEPRSNSGVRTSLMMETYPVEGSTANEVLASLAARGPRPEGEVFFGLTTAEISLRYQPRPVEGGCLLTDVEIDLALTVTLPEWSAPAQSDPDLASDWGRFRRALAGHEDRHLEIAESSAKAILRTLDGLRRSSCDIVTDEARRRLERMEIETESAQRRYDSETGHGRTEGASWPR